MVLVPSSMGRSDSPQVRVTITGLEDTRRMLGEFANAILDKEREFLIRAADMVRSEVKESIIGNRGEPKSVDTGNFANSIAVQPGNNSVIIYTDIPYAQFLEYGTSRMMPRAHFQNTAFRVQPFLREMMVEMVKQAKGSAASRVGISVS